MYSYAWAKVQIRELKRVWRTEGANADQQICRNSGNPVVAYTTPNQVRENHRASKGRMLLIQNCNSSHQSKSRVTSGRLRVQNDFSSSGTQTADWLRHCVTYQEK